MNDGPQTNDPLQIFPYEIWLEIVAFAIVDSADGPLPFLAVSSRWSETILSTPSLWTTVIIDNGEDESAHIHSFLFLSQKLPLDVIVLKPFSNRTSLAKLAQEASRIAWLSIRFNNAAGGGLEILSQQASQILEQVFKDGQSYPEMNSLEVDELISPTLPEKFLQNCPNLCYFRCVPLHEYSPGDGQKSEFYNFIPPKKALQFYQHPNLQSLSLSYRNFPSDRDAWAEHLKQLALGPTGRLRELTIAFPSEHITIIPLLLKAFSQLHTLGLQFDFIGQGSVPNTPSLNPSDLCSVRNLSIDLLSSFISPVQPWCDLIVRLFAGHAALINLDTLSFDTGGYPCNTTQLNALLYSAINVHVLKLKLGPGADSQMENFPAGLQVPSLTRLHSVSLSPALLIDHLVVPNTTHVSLEGSWGKLPLTKALNLGAFISRLMISSTDFDNLNKDLSPTEIASRWGNLRYIQLSSQDAGKSAASLMSLQVVEFSKAKFGAYQPGLNSFLLELLKNRGSCPRLAAIKSSDYPCWWLLFEALRGRILSQLCRITHVTLPAHPVFPILSHLVSLLRGNSSQVGWEDIDTAIMRRFEEHADASCTSCIQTGYFNCSYSKPESSPAPYALTYDWPPDPPIRQDHDLGTVRNDDVDWEARLQSLESVINGRGYGWGACSQHPGGAEISGYTLEGISSVEYIRGSNESGKVPGK